MYCRDRSNQWLIGRGDSWAHIPLYGTTTPTRKMIEDNMDFFDQLERGRAVYIIAYTDGKPDEVFLADSFD